MCQHVPCPHPHFYLLILAASCFLPSLQLSPTQYQVLIFQSRLLVQYRIPQTLKPSYLDRKYRFPTLQVSHQEDAPKLRTIYIHKCYMQAVADTNYHSCMTIHISQGIRVHAALKSALICANREHLRGLLFSC